MHTGLVAANMDYQDLVQFACVGLLESIARYEPGGRASFKTYCTPRIRGAILEGIRKWTDAHEQISFQHRLRRERLAFLDDATSGGDPFGRLASLATGLAIGMMLEGTGMYAEHQESHSPYGNGYESTAWQQSCAKLRQAVSALPEAAGKVIRYHYFDLLPFEQIAVLLGLSKGRISQLHRDGLEELRQVLPLAHFTTMG